jgi:hypothetical protein
LMNLVTSSGGNRALLPVERSTLSRLRKNAGLEKRAALSG